MKRPVFSFRPNLNDPDNKKAWEILQGVPKGQRNQYLVQAILKTQEGEYLKKLIQETIREAIICDDTTHLTSKADDGLPTQMLDFLSKM